MLMGRLGLGQAILSTAVGAVAQTLSHAEGGLLFRPGDAAALAASRERLVREPELLGRLERNARMCYEQHFSFDRFGEGFVELLREVNSSRKGKLAASKESAA